MTPGLRSSTYLQAATLPRWMPPVRGSYDNAWKSIARALLVLSKTIVLAADLPLCLLLL